MNGHHHHRHYRDPHFLAPLPKKQKGPYQLKVEEMAKVIYPNLRYLAEFMDKNDNTQSSCHPKCIILDVSADNKRLVETTEDHPDFNRILQDFNPEMTPSHTLFVLEDLSTSWIEYFGSRLNVDPHFFANHLRSSEYEHNNSKTNAYALPSARRGRNFFVLSYFKPILLHTKIGLYRTKITNFNALRRMTLRHVKNYESDSHEITIGLVTRLACYWHKEYGNNSWVGLLLTDPALPNPFNVKAELSNDEKESKSVNWEHYGGGYVDFRPWAKIQNMSHLNRHEGQSMGREVLYYWMESFPITDDIKPWDRTNIILQKIALSDWMLTLAFLRRDFDALRIQQIANENVDVDGIDKTLAEAASSRNLVSKCCSFARRNLISLGIQPTEELYFSQWKTQTKDPLDETNCDWAFLYMELEHWKTDTDMLINYWITLLDVLNSKRQVADSEREKAETRDLNRLTYLGAFFGPVTFTAGILSMGGDFAPGKGKFWVFWLTWIPMTLLIIIWWQMSRTFEKWRRSFIESKFANLRTTQQE